MYRGGGPCYFPSKDVLLPPVNSQHNREMSPFYPDAFAAPMGSRVPFNVKLRDEASSPGPEAGVC